MRLTLVALVAVIPLAAACATGPSVAAEASPPQLELVKAACTRIVRLEQGQAQWDGCVSDLSTMVAYLNQNRQMFDTKRACLAAGLKPETPGFSDCLLNREDGVRSARPAFMDASLVQASDSDSRSYFSAPFDLRRSREKHACAAIGVEPGSGGFVSCVNNLATDLFNIGNTNG